MHSLSPLACGRLLFFVCCAGRHVLPRSIFVGLEGRFFVLQELFAGGQVSNWRLLAFFSHFNFLLLTSSFLKYPIANLPLGDDSFWEAVDLGYGATGDVK